MVYTLNDVLLRLVEDEEGEKGTGGHLFAPALRLIAARCWWI
jgi:hypothetical protein